MGIYERSISDFIITNLFVDAVQKSFKKITRSSIKEYIECTLKFNPGPPETERKLLSSTNTKVR